MMENRTTPSRAGSGAGSQSTQRGPAGPPAISVPKGGGAIKGIDEKFSVNPATGTGALTFPISTTASRQGFHPQLSLAYDSGSGNGPFGLGWSLSVPRITRKTDKGLPRYRDAASVDAAASDAAESDTFILSGAEDLVPALRRAAGAKEAWERDTLAQDGYQIQRYRPRTEGLFARIERWQQIETGEVFWKSISKENVTSLYGITENGRLADPDEPSHVFQWLLEASFDDRGNLILYEYKQEDAANVDRGLPQEKNRLANGTSYANRYLKRIWYGNQTPFECRDWLAPYTAYRENPGAHENPFRRSDWLFQVVFDYGEHDGAQPTPDEVQVWPVRSDPFSSYRSGFELRTQRLCRRVLVFHHFPELGATPCLVRSTDLAYDESPIVSYLTSVTQTGYAPQGDGQPYTRRSLPPLEFGYSRPQVDDTVRAIDAGSLENLPEGLGGASYQWVDLDGEGISGILTEQGDGWFYKRNLGGFRFDPIQPTVEGPNPPPSPREPGPPRFAPARLVATRPSLANLRGGRQQIMDLAGDGKLDLVLLGEAVTGFYERDDGHWASFRPFRLMPDVDWQDPNLRLIDLNGDGHADVLLSNDDLFVWHASRGEAGFGPAECVRRLHDEERGPALVFADTTQSVYLADMSGDGLVDIARIRNGEVAYWPNLGYGRFGAKVTMDGAPTFDAPDQFDQKRLRLADIDGSGTSDILYLGAAGVSLYFNQSGNSWSPARHLALFPRADTLSSVTVADLMGNGTACLVWSSPLPGDAARPVRYVDLMGGVKPHLLTSMVNNLGAETTLQYAPSTKFYLEDQAAGQPWITRLAFPVHVVERVEVNEQVSGARLVTLYRYHHGYYDGEEREFRGFGLVEQWDTESFEQFTGAASGVVVEEDLYLPPAYTKTWFHTGAYLEGESISRHFAREYYRGDPAAILLADTLLPPGLSAWEEREACRALKGQPLRQEVYALDGTPESAHPYTVSETNYQLKQIQPLADQRHAVFYAHQREALNYHYERNPDDPRLSQALTLEVDGYGNVTKSVAVGYPRRGPQYPEQAQTLVTYTEAEFVNRPGETGWYRVGLPCETRTYQLTGFTPAGGLTFAPSDFLDPAQPGIELRYDRDLRYEETPTGGRERRLIERARTRYRRDDLGGPLPWGQIESLALPYESYEAAFTPELLDQIYGSGRVDAQLLAGEGGYLFEDGLWWLPTGRAFYSPDPNLPDPAFAGDHFYLAQGFRDPFGNVAKTTYDGYDLLVRRTEDALGNTTQAENSYRTLQPWRVTGPNGNRSEVAFDALGLVVGTAVRGKAGEGLGDSLEGFEPDLSESQIRAYLDDPRAGPDQLLQRATTRLVYDLERYRDLGQPAVGSTLARETHDADLAPGVQTRIQHSFLYSDGLGREVQTKVQAEPGPTPQRNAEGQVIVVDGEPVMTDTDTDPRWASTGRKVYNNKGHPVKQYEPFFSHTHLYEGEESLVNWGVTPILRYDPLGRLIRTDNANGTLSRVDFDAWQQATWDENDTVLESAWYDERGAPDPKDPEPADPEQRAAYLAAGHANTPAVAHLDTLGRAFLTIADNGARGQYPTRVALDIEGNPLRITDARHNPVMAYAYDMRAPEEDEEQGDEDEEGANIHRIYQRSMDAGERWVLYNVAGNPIRAWDSREHTIWTQYDALQRLTHIYVQRGQGAEVLVERLIYGEAHPQALNLNLRTKLHLHLDGAGLLTNEAFDFKGNLLRSSRRLSREYRLTVDWRPVANLNAPQDIMAAAATQLENETFAGSVEYDALNRPTRLVTPDGSQTRPTYNEANLLERVDARLRGAVAWTPFVLDVDYNAKGQRERIAYANGTQTGYAYDPDTFRLTRLRTARAADGAILQDLQYTYDPAGNITEIGDDAQQAVYFANQFVSPQARYAYDALYRLVEATGREQIGQTTNCPAWRRPDLRPHYDISDCARRNLPHPSDGQAMRRYTQAYQYDKVGNILRMAHTAHGDSSASWTRYYAYAADSNRLEATSLPGDGPLGPYTGTYDYDAHGNMISMPHLPDIRWDYEDQMLQVDLGGGGTAYYTYDTGGERVRKVHQHNGSLLEERIYLGGYEIYRKRNAGGLQLVRETLHIMDSPSRPEGGSERRIALVETKTYDGGAPVPDPAPLTRYQLGNHLDSASLELDGDGAIISYEEYHPYGTTAYHTARGGVEASPKRYRYTGKERDEETGLNYHGARYYAPWLGRWISTDPIFREKSLLPSAAQIHEDKVNLDAAFSLPSSYESFHDNPIYFVDPDGFQPEGKVKMRQAPKMKGGKLYSVGRILFELVKWIIGGDPVKPTNPPPPPAVRPSTSPTRRTRRRYHHEPGDEPPPHEPPPRKPPKRRRARKPRLRNRPRTPRVNRGTPRVNRGAFSPRPAVTGTPARVCRVRPGGQVRGVSWLALVAVGSRWEEIREGKSAQQKLFSVARALIPQLDAAAMTLEVSGAGADYALRTRRSPPPPGGTMLGAVLTGIKRKFMKLIGLD